MKLLVTLVAIVALAGCDSHSSRPSDDQLLAAVVANIQSQGAPQDLIDTVKGGSVNNVSCVSEQYTTCNFNIGAMKHVAVFAKTGDGVWGATSVDGS